MQIQVIRGSIYQVHTCYFLSSTSSRIFHHVLLPYIFSTHRSKIVTAWVTVSLSLFSNGQRNTELSTEWQVQHTSPEGIFLIFFSCRRDNCHEYLLTNFFDVKGDGFTFVLLDFFSGWGGEWRTVGETKQHETIILHKFQKESSQS